MYSKHLKEHDTTISGTYTQTEPDSRDSTMQSLNADIEKISNKISALIQSVYDKGELINALKHDNKHLRQICKGVT